MRKVFVATEAAKRADEALETAIARRKMACISGPPGVGKTSWARAFAARPEEGRRVCYLRLRSHVGTRLRSGLYALLSALSGEEEPDPYWPVAERADRLYAELVSALRTAMRDGELVLMIDEGDYLGGGDLLHTIRDLHDDTGATFAFLSISGLARKFAAPSPGAMEGVASRVSVQVSFARPDARDAQRLADGLVEGVALEPDLTAYCLKLARGTVRPLVDAFAEIERVAEAAGLKRIDLARWLEIQTLSRGASAPKRQRPQKAPSVMLDDDELEGLWEAIAISGRQLSERETHFLAHFKTTPPAWRASFERTAEYYALVRRRPELAKKAAAA